MKKRKLLAAVAFLAVAGTAAAVELAPAAHADVAGPYFATQGLGSDPHIIACTDPSTGTNGFCLYTSRDMGQASAYPPANFYPMEETRVYFSANGYNNWIDKGQAFHENTIEVGNGRWVPNNAFHLWAPSAIKNGNTYYLYVPDVTNTSNTGSTNVHNSSRVAVASSLSPFGPFNYLGVVDTAPTYTSDPDVVFNGTSLMLTFADGDFSTCGSFQSVRLGSDMRTVQFRSRQFISINGIGVLGNCGGTGHPYMEGPSLYHTGSNWTMYFAAKPDHVPTECTTDVNGPGTDNEVIAWATSSSPQGPFTYKGIVMCGSSSEWTNQATVNTAPNGKKYMIYHDSADGVKERRLHAECLFMTGTVNGLPNIIAGVYRQPIDASNGFNDCMAGVNASYVGLHMVDPQFPSYPPIVRAPQDGSALTANRYAVGPWERYRKVTVGTCCNIAYQALSNGKYLCTPNSGTPVSASCNSPNDVGASWSPSSGNGGVNLRNNNNNLFLSVAGNGLLYASGLDVSAAVVVNTLFMGGQTV